MDNEVAEARARLAQRFGKVQLGGKGKQARSYYKFNGMVKLILILTFCALLVCV